MNTKATALFALLMPGLVMLAACNRSPDADDAATPPVAAADTTPAATTPAATMPADTMSADEMAAMPGMAGDEMSFADMDKNHDGGIAHDELSSTDMLDQHFSVADTDGNGMLSEAEVTKHRADMAAAPAQ